MKRFNVNTPQIYEYNGSNITFLNGDDVMANATEMAKAFGKQPKEFLRLPSTASFIEALSSVRKSPTSDFQAVITVMGSPENGGGTWMHEDVAIEFARWLSPHFAIWCNDRIKELVKHGLTAINPDEFLNPDYVIKVMTALKEERAEKEALKMTTQLQEKELKESAPKVEYHDKVLQSESLISATELANELGFRTAQALNSHLKAQGIIKRVNNTWAMCADLSGLGLAKYKTHSYTDSKGQPQTHRHLYFTEKGRKALQRFSQKPTSKAKTNG